MKTFILAALVAALGVPAGHAATFDFTETFAIDARGEATAPVVATGSFDGDLSGTLITNLRNISVFVNGVAFNRNGALYAGSYDAAEGLFAPGNATASLDGSANNFFFADAAMQDPAGTLPTNQYYHVSANQLSALATGITDTGITGATGLSTSRSVGIPLTIVQVGAAVPEPASWALMLVGFAVVGHAMRRRPTMRFAQAV
ncbi:hypothetical protein ASE95_16550 [Sphingomonas sp. Leaf231]|uniref:PEPxxWA-CTERM sorting domain-containing protein n=1 Tax=Sphingomonas sp. Leaf231 TaxID=1736301 RepID=UPI0006FEC87C|nr:PEPxxWA-CTERM sorting domain-containing protein [Sphingomonas sp. Leaf231]KQN89791.1 hypothetical protein ASE95_16550 [Sphingomonas sp. Leaf231]